MSIERFNSPEKVQRTGGDSIYGNGIDGNVVILSNTTLSRDLYCENLTLGNANTHNNPIIINTNGFRVFVKDSLIIADGAYLSCESASASDGTVARGRLSNFGNVTYSLGGNASSLYSVSSLTDSQKSDFLSLISGVITDTDGSINAIQGGASGAPGDPGVLTPATSGGSGHLNRNPLVAGGPGSPGTNVPQAQGGAGTGGGGIVVVAAKNIKFHPDTYGVFGYITAGAIPYGVEAGEPSSTGNNGSAAPSAVLTHLVDSSADYITGNGVTGPTASIPAPLLPHGGHVPSLLGALHGHTYRHVHRGADHARYDFYYGDHHSGYNYGSHPSGGNYQHTYNTYTVSPPSSSYYAINSIPHTSPHRAHTGVAYSSDFSHHGNGNTTYGGGTHAAHYGSYSDNPAGTHSHTPAHHFAGDKHLPASHLPAYDSVFHYPRNHQDINYSHFRQRSAGTVSSQGSNSYPGGTAGVAGSTTAGSQGVAGGGGGVIIVTSYIESYDGTLATEQAVLATGGLDIYNNTYGQDGTVIIIVND